MHSKPLTYTLIWKALLDLASTALTHLGSLFPSTALDVFFFNASSCLRSRTCCSLYLERWSLLYPVKLSGSRFKCHLP